MVNPFVQSQAGVFATLRPPQGAAAPLAALICAKIAHRLAQPPAGTSALDPDWWSEVFNKVPFLGVAASSDATISDRTPTGLAGLCLGPGVKADVPGGAASLARYIAAAHPAPASLNSLAVTGTGNVINLSLAFLDIVRGKLVRTDAALNLAASDNRNALQSLFASEPPLSSEPYFCAL